MLARNLLRTSYCVLSRGSLVLETPKKCLFYQKINLPLSNSLFSSFNKIHFSTTSTTKNHKDITDNIEAPDAEPDPPEAIAEVESCNNSDNNYVSDNQSSESQSSETLNNEENFINSDNDATETQSSKNQNKEGQPSDIDLDQALGLIKKKDEEIQQFREKWLLALADMENLRKRTEREMDNNRKYCISSWAKQLLEVADNLSLAISAFPIEEIEKNNKIKEFHEGIILTEKSLQTAFNKGGITKMISKGACFDPNIHEALFEIDDPKLEPGTIGVVIKEGYTIFDRVLRAAKVGSVKKPKPNNNSAKQTEQIVE